MMRALAILLLFVQIACGAVSREVTVTQFGADPTGVADSSDAFTRAYAASSTVLIPRGTYKIAAGTTAPANEFITGEDGATILVYTQLPLTLANGCHVYNVAFDTSNNSQTAARMIEIPAGQVNGCVVERCKFVGNTGSTGVYAENQNFENTVRACEFTTGSQGIFLNGTLRSRLQGNRFLNISHAIEICGGSECELSHNVCLNGVTGILFISLRTNGDRNKTFGNSVTGNLIYNTSEEGISFDCRGNSQALWPENGTNPIVTFASISHNSGSQDAMLIAETGQATDWATTYYAIPLSGNNVGHHFYISGSGNGFIDTERSNGDGAAWTVGDKLLITMPFMGNVVANNTCTACGTAGITFWGTAWWNVIDTNTIQLGKQYGIELASPVAALGSSGNWGLQAWSGFNSITNNTIQMVQQNSVITDPLHYPIYCGVNQFGTPIAGIVYMPGNRIEKNHINSSRYSYVNQAYRTRILDNEIAPGGSFTINNTDLCTYGRNYVAGLLDGTGTSLTQTGTNTNVTIIATP
jgi:parallel beta-helix repeat protein